MKIYVVRLKAYICKRRLADQSHCERGGYYEPAMSHTPWTKNIEPLIYKNPTILDQVKRYPIRSMGQLFAIKLVVQVFNGRIQYTLATKSFLKSSLEIILSNRKRFTQICNHMVWQRNKNFWFNNYFQLTFHNNGFATNRMAKVEQHIPYHLFND